MRFENTEALRNPEFVNVDLTGARFREALLVDVRVSGLIKGLIVNDIEVAPRISAEMDRRYPERTKLAPSDSVDPVRRGVASQLVRQPRPRRAEPADMI
jgi:hypothetical protein